MRKILIHINSLGKGGAERVVNILSGYFADRGCDITIATLWNAEEEYVPDSRVKRIHVGLTASEEKKGRLYKIFYRILKFRKCVKKQNPDIVISFCNKANFRSAMALLGTGIPLLVSVRNDPQRDYAPYPLHTKIMELRADGCVFQTPDAGKFFGGRLRKRSKIILNPISDEYLSDAGDGKTCRSRDIVTVGRITRQKNQMLLVRAFAQLCGRYPGYRLRLYGKTEEPAVYEEMKSFIEANRLADRILFMGECAAKGRIKDAALFVLPSDYEGMPNALIEAMTLGVPSVATDCPCGGPAMLIENNRSGLLVKPGDEAGLVKAMEYMLTHPVEAEKMGMEARKLNEKVKADVIGKEWLDYIDSIVNGKSKRNIGVTE